MAELKKSPSKIPRFKPSAKQFDKENIAVKSPARPAQRRTKKAPTVRDVKVLPKPTATQKARKSPFLISQTNGKTSAQDAPPKSVATLQDRRGISEIRRSERELRLTMDRKEKEISILQENIVTLYSSMTKKDQEICSMSQTLESLQERLEAIENDNAILADKLDELNVCPVTGNKLLCMPIHSAVLGNVKNSISAERLLERVMRISLPDIEIE